jgi:hypothetical protein
MASCAYCDKVATENIPSDSGRVCVTHAMEFWTGLLAHAIGRRTNPSSAQPLLSGQSDSKRLAPSSSAARAIQ